MVIAGRALQSLCSAVNKRCSFVVLFVFLLGDDWLLCFSEDCITAELLVRGIIPNCRHRLACLSSSSFHRNKLVLHPELCRSNMDLSSDPTTQGIRELCLYYIHTFYYIRVHYKEVLLYWVNLHHFLFTCVKWFRNIVSMSVFFLDLVSCTIASVLCPNESKAKEVFDYSQVRRIAEGLEQEEKYFQGDRELLMTSIFDRLAHCWLSNEFPTIIATSLLEEVWYIFRRTELDRRRDRYTDKRTGKWTSQDRELLLITSSLVPRFMTKISTYY